MPDQSVRQFRPTAMDVLYEDPGFPRPLDSEICQVLAYIERLENALDHVGTMIQIDQIQSTTSDQVIGHFADEKPPFWHFLTGEGETLLEAIESDMEEPSDD